MSPIPAVTQVYLLNSSRAKKISVFIAHSFYRSISLVHIRAFSFTDDSVSVTRPRQRGGSPGTTQVFLNALNPAMHLNRLRRIESDAYQKLFQSSRPGQEELWPTISSSIEDMHKFSTGLPDDLETPIKRILRCEALYSSILILSPPDLDDDITDYGKFLIFEYAVEYADLMLSVTSDAEEFVFYTSLDMLRASFVVKRLLALFLSDFGLLFGSNVSRIPLNVTTPSQAPVIQSRTVGEMLSRAHRCLNLCDNILEYLELRFGYSDTLKGFRVQSSDLRRRILQASHEEWNRSPHPNGHDHFTLAGGSVDRRFS